MYSCVRELPTTNGVNPIPQPRSTTYSTSSREEKNGYEVAPGLDHVLEEKQYKGHHSLGYPSEDILESRYGGRISPPSRRSPSEYQHTDSGYPSTSPVSMKAGAGGGVNEWESIWEWSQYKFVLKLHSWKLKKIDAQPLTSFKKVYSQ